MKTFCFIFLSICLPLFAEDRFLEIELTPEGAQLLNLKENYITGKQIRLTKENIVIEQNTRNLQRFTISRKYIVGLKFFQSAQSPDVATSSPQPIQNRNEPIITNTQIGMSTRGLGDLEIAKEVTPEPAIAASNPKLVINRPESAIPNSNENMPSRDSGGGLEVAKKVAPEPAIAANSPETGENRGKTVTPTSYIVTFWGYTFDLLALANEVHSRNPQLLIQKLMSSDVRQLKDPEVNAVYKLIQAKMMAGYENRPGYKDAIAQSDKLIDGLASGTMSVEQLQAIAGKVSAEASQYTPAETKDYPEAGKWSAVLTDFANKKP